MRPISSDSHCGAVQFFGSDGSSSAVTELSSNFKLLNLVHLARDGTREIRFPQPCNGKYFFSGLTINARPASWLQTGVCVYRARIERNAWKSCIFLSGEGSKRRTTCVVCDGPEEGTKNHVLGKWIPSSTVVKTIHASPDWDESVNWGRALSQLTQRNLVSFGLQPSATN